MKVMLIVCFIFKNHIFRTLAQLEDDVAPCEAQMENWKTNLQVMAAKERQYLQQCANYKVFKYYKFYTLFSVLVTYHEKKLLVAIQGMLSFIINDKKCESFGGMMHLQEVKFHLKPMWIE